MARKIAIHKNTPSIQVGVSGEYFVAAELSRQGYIASVTMRNTEGIDVLASSPDASRLVGIQVKTNRGKDKKWILNKKAELHHSATFFYVFVNLNNGEEQPSYHIVPSKIVAEFVQSDHQEWLNQPGKKGQPHNDTPMRHFLDEGNKYADKWDLLRLKTTHPA
jgi:hypothetical protein